MIATLVVIVPGEPDTDHRPRSTPGRRRPHTSAKHRAWKARVRLCGKQIAAAWTREHGTQWPTLVRYAVRVLGYSAKARLPDADNLRGALDALQHVLWRSDARCQPVTYDVERAGPEGPMLRLEVMAYDPRTTLVEAVWQVREVDDG